MTIRFAVCYWWSIGTEPLSRTFRDIQPQRLVHTVRLHHRGVIWEGEGRSGQLPQGPSNKKYAVQTTHTRRHILARRLPWHGDVQTVCLHKYVTTRPPIVPQFDVSFRSWKAPEDCCYQRRDFFSLKFTKYRLAAGLRPDPLGEQNRSQDPLHVTRGPILLRGGEGRRGEEEGRNGCHILAKRLPCHCDVQTVCLRGSIFPLGHPAPQFGDSFPEKQHEDRGY